MTYAEKLKDPRWQRRRLEVMELANFSCEDCGSSTKTLNVHHCYYVHKKQPWEYGRSLMCLCEYCHKYRQSYEQQIHVNMALAMRYMTHDELHVVWDRELREIQKFLDNRGISWPENMPQEIPAPTTTSFPPI